MDILRDYLLLFILSWLLYFLPGYLLLRAYTSWRGAKLLASAFGFSFVLYIVLAFLSFLVPALSGWYHLIPISTLAMFLVILVLVKKIDLWSGTEIPLRLFLCFLAFYILAFSYQILTPLYTGAGWYGDWWESYEIVNFYLGHRDPNIVFFGHDTIPSRPPAYHLLTAFPLTSFAESGRDPAFFYLPLLSVLPGIAFFWPAYLLAQKILKAKTLEIFPYLLIFSPFLAQSALYPWSKMLAAFFILTAANFFWDYYQGEPAGDKKNKNNLAWAGFWSAWGYLAHPTALFYIIGMVIFAWWRSRGKARLAPASLFPIPYFLFPAFLVLLPWHLWVVYQYGPQAVITANPSLAHQSAAGWGEFLGIRVINFIGNIFPLWLIEAGINMFSSTEPLISRWYLLYSGFLRGYYNVLPGALSAVVSILLLYHLFKTEKTEAVLKRATALPFGNLINKLRVVYHTPLVFFLFLQIVCGFVAIILAQPYKTAEGLTAQGMAPVVIILLILGAYLLDSLEPKFKLLAIGAVILEFFLVRGSHLIFLHQGFLGRAGDRNLALKQSHGLTFPADNLGAASAAFWFFWLLWVVLGFILVRLFIVTSRQENH